MDILGLRERSFKSKQDLKSSLSITQKVENTGEHRIQGLRQEEAIEMQKKGKIYGSAD